MNRREALTAMAAAVVVPSTGEPPEQTGEWIVMPEEVRLGSGPLPSNPIWIDVSGTVRMWVSKPSTSVDLTP